MRLRFELNWRVKLNIQVIDRPNGTAVFAALGIYLDVMRPFVVQNMPVFKNGTATERELIRDSIPVDMRRDWDKQIVVRDDVSLAIELTHLPHIVRKNWRHGFSEKFGGDRGYLEKMEGLSKLRNLVCHPLAADLSLKQAESAFFCVEKITGRINRHDASAKVSEVRERLVAGWYQACPDALAQLSSSEGADIQAELEGMRLRMGELTAELAELRQLANRSRSSRFMAGLRRALPRVRIDFPYASGNFPVPRDASAEYEPADEGKSDAEVAEVASSSNGRVVHGAKGEPQDNGHAEGDAGPSLVKFERG